MPKLDGVKTFSLEEIIKHNNEVRWEVFHLCFMSLFTTQIYNNARIILENSVYDVTSVPNRHPGGAKATRTHVGKPTVDATNEVRDDAIRRP